MIILIDITVLKYRGKVGVAMCVVRLAGDSGRRARGDTLIITNVNIIKEELIKGTLG